MFEWDREKDLINIAKHGVNFDVAKRIFAGSTLTWVDEREDYGEVRKISIGMADDTAVLNGKWSPSSLAPSGTVTNSSMTCESPA